MSTAAPLEALPVASESDACDYELAGWRCRGTHYLWRNGEAPQTTGVYPCPKCNTVGFLRRAQGLAEARAPMMAGCACCAPGQPSGAAIWQSAVEVAMEENPAAARRALAGIGRVKAFDDKAALATFLYPSEELADAG